MVACGRSSLHDEIVAFMSWLEPRSEERTARQQVVSRVSKVISGRFRDALVTVVGSVAHELSLPDGFVLRFLYDSRYRILIWLHIGSLQ